MPDASDELRLQMTSDAGQIAQVRHRVEAFATGHGFDETAVGEIGLALNEAIANIIRHAYTNQPGLPIEIDLTMAGDTLRLALRDYGNGRTPDLSRGKADVSTPGGLGLVCMKQLMNDLRFEPQADGMLLLMTKTRR